MLLEHVYVCVRVRLCVATDEQWTCENSLSVSEAVLDDSLSM